jgi:type II secretory pathway pseudopilin PulG
MRPAAERPGEAGFTYLGLLIILAIIGVVAAASLQAGALMQRRDAEEGLLDVGSDFRTALRSYADSTPAGLPRAPRALQDLLRDPRYPGVRRYLRRVPPDPMGGVLPWGLVMSPDGAGIIGIYSQAPGHPIKQDNFPAAYQDFRNRDSYADWVFTQAPARNSQLPSRPIPLGPGTSTPTAPSPGAATSR